MVPPTRLPRRRPRALQSRTSESSLCAWSGLLVESPARCRARAAKSAGNLRQARLRHAKGRGGWVPDGLSGRWLTQSRIDARPGLRPTRLRRRRPVPDGRPGPAGPPLVPQDRRRTHRGDGSGEDDQAQAPPRWRGDQLTGPDQQDAGLMTIRIRWPATVRRGGAAAAGRRQVSFSRTSRMSAFVRVVWRSHRAPPLRRARPRGARLVTAPGVQSRAPGGPAALREQRGTPQERAVRRCAAPAGTQPMAGATCCTIVLQQPRVVVDAEHVGHGDQQGVGLADGGVLGQLLGEPVGLADVALAEPGAHALEDADLVLARPLAAEVLRGPRR